MREYSDLIFGMIAGFLLGVLLGVVIGSFDVSVHVYVSEAVELNDGTDSGVGCTDDCLDSELSTNPASHVVAEEGV